MNMYLTLQNPITRIQNALKIGWTAILFIALWLGISLSVWAQPQYDFEAVSGTFTPITGGVDVNSIEADDAISATLPLGFSFTYNGVAYTQFRASSNGWMTFNTTATANTAANGLSGAATTIRPVLAPLWEDLDGRATGGSVASYLTTGAAGSRVFTMEWLNWEWNWQSTDATISFQVKLYEATGVIEYIYRQEAGAINTGSVGASIGLTTASGTGANTYLSLNNSSASPSVSSTTETTTILTKPATGQVYRFSPKLFNLTPADNATAIALASNLSIEFLSATPTIGTGTIELRKTTGGTLVESFVLPSPRVTVAGNTVTIDPTIILECNTEYYVILPNGSITAGAFAGITSTTRWSFTTTAPMGVPASITTLLDENFGTATGSTPPTGWVSNIIGGAATDVWRFDNPGNRTATGFTAPFAIFDSDNYSGIGPTPAAENVALETPAFNAAVPAGTNINLSFKHYFNDGSGGGYNVEVFNGTAWTSVLSGTVEVGTAAAPVTENININVASGGNAAAKVRFRWTGNWSWYWIVDDVKVTSSTTELPFTATFTPTNGATNVAQNSNLVLNFDFPIQAGTGNIEIVNTATGAVLETIPAGDVRVNYSVVGRVTINPTTDFPAGAVVAVRFPTGAFQSCNSIKIVGITNTTDWRFTVADPCASLTVGAGPDQIGLASGSNVTLAGVAATGGSGNFTYAWTPAANFSNPTILNPIVSNVVTSTIYTLTVTDITTNCTKTSTVFVSILPPAGGGGGGGSASSVRAPLLRITSTGATTLRLNWSDGDANNYAIFRKGANSTSFVRLREVAGSISTFLDSMLMPNTAYSYYVQAIRGSSTANSNIVSDYTYPSLPTVAGFQNACVGTGAQLSVKGSTGAYNIYSAATGGTAVAIGDSTRTILTPTFADSTTFYVSAIGTRYESTPRVAVRVITRPLPVATMLGAAMQQSCTDSLTIMAEAVDGATYTWYSSDAPVATTSVPMYTVNRSGVYSVLVNKEGCLARSATVIVRVNVVSPAQILGLSNRQFCETGTLQALETEGASYEWQLGSVVVGNESTLTVTQSGSYTVTVTSALGCVLTSSPISVTVINVPQLDLQTSADAFCEGTEGVELTVNAVSGAIYEWFRNGRKIRTTSVPSLQVNVGAEYRVRVILNGTCSRTSDAIIVTRNMAPSATARVYGDSVKVVYNGTVAITSITWTKDDAPFEATTQAFAPTESGIYQATITYSTGCQTVSVPVQYIKRPEPPIVVGEDEVEALGFMLFPNPTANKVNLSFGDAFKGEVTLTLTDAIGRTIQVVKVKATENATLDLSTLANGNYMLTIASNDKVVTRKIIRE